MVNLRAGGIVKFSFAHSSKDGGSFPVNWVAMDQGIVFMREALESARRGNEVRVYALGCL